MLLDRARPPRPRPRRGRLRAGRGARLHPRPGRGRESEVPTGRRERTCRDGRARPSPEPRSSMGEVMEAPPMPVTRSALTSRDSVGGAGRRSASHCAGAIEPAGLTPRRLAWRIRPNSDYAGAISLLSSGRNGRWQARTRGMMPCSHSARAPGRSPRPSSWPRTRPTCGRCWPNACGARGTSCGRRATAARR